KAWSSKPHPLKWARPSTPISTTPAATGFACCRAEKSCTRLSGRGILVRPTSGPEVPMLYAFLCYNNESTIMSLSKAQDDAVMDPLYAVHERLKKQGKLGPSLRLRPTTAATTLVKEKDLVLDGPYAETKEALLGFYILDCENLEDAIAIA